MKPLGLGIFVALGLTLPVKAAEAERAKMPEGIYVLNVAKSTVIRGALPLAQVIRLEKDKSTVVTIGPNGGVGTFTIPLQDPPEFGKPHPITDSPIWDSTVTTQLDPFTFSEVRSKDGKPITKLITVLNPKGNFWTVSAVGPVNTTLFVYEKQ